MRFLVLYPGAPDRCGRPTFVDSEGRAYVDIDYQKNPRREILTKYPRHDAYYGEPDCHLADDVTVVFADGPFHDLVEEVNDRLERAGSDRRYMLTEEGRVFRCLDIYDGGDFDEIHPQRIATVLENELKRLEEAK